jgi:hypothetical protein
VQGPGEDPMSGVVVRVLASSPTVGGAGVGGRAISDAHGRYVVGGHPPGEHSVSFDVLAGVRPVTVAAGRVSEANIVVPPGRAVIGRVIDAQSGPALQKNLVVGRIGNPSITEETTSRTSVCRFRHRLLRRLLGYQAGSGRTEELGSVLSPLP